MIYHKRFKQIVVANFFFFSTTACSGYEPTKNNMDHSSEQEIKTKSHRGKLYEEGEAVRVTLNIKNSNESNGDEYRNKSKFKCLCCECGCCCCTCTILGILGVATIGVYCLGAYVFHWFPQIHMST